MTYRVEKNGDIVIDGWEKGIADTPYDGIADMRNVNIDAVPGEVSVNLKTAALTIPPTVSAVAFTAVGATDIVTVSSTTGYYNGMAITLNSTSAGGTSTGRVYWVTALSGNTFKLCTNPGARSSTIVDITSDGSGTLSSYTLGEPLDKITVQTTGTVNYTLILDKNGRVWWIDVSGGTVTNNLCYLGNDDLSSTKDRGIAVWKGYVIVARSGFMDALSTSAIESAVDLDGASGWDYQFENISSAGRNERRVMLVGQDDVLYYDNSFRVGSLSEVVGSSFNPTDALTFIENTTALDLPNGEAVTAFGELGVFLLVGTNTQRVFPWDRVSPSFNYPLFMPEANVAFIVGANQLAYVFCGNRGNIYVTDGTRTELFKKIPDHITGKNQPYFTWVEATSHRNNLVFSFTADENDGTDITSIYGVWAINLTEKALRHIITASNGSSAQVTVLMSNPHPGPLAGEALIVGWKNSTTYGVDIGSSNPYTGGETVISTDMIPIGTNLNKVTPQDFEIKFSRPLVSGESVALKSRVNLTASFGSAFLTENGVDAISARGDTDFENAEWVQLQLVLTSTTTTPSRCPVREIRIRK